MALTIDLFAPTIPAERKVWRLFPGNGYQFLPSFINARSAFLDIPAFPLPPGKLSEAGDVVDRLVFSEKAKEKLYRDGPESAIDADLDHFKNSRNTKHRGRIAQAIVNLLTEAKVGDLLVMPTALGEGRVWVGRFRDDDIANEIFPKRYGAQPIPARNVDWFATVDEGAISSPLRKILRQQHPFSLIERSLWVEVLAIAYGSFVFGDRHVSTIFNDEDFIDADASFLGNISKLASAACAAIDEGRTLDPRDLLDLLLESPPVEYTSSQQIDIHSPGFNRYTSGTIVALVIAGLVAAFIAMPADKAQLAPVMQNMVVINSSPDADPQCTAKVREAQKQVMEVLGVDRALKLCDAARKAQARAGLRSSAKSR